MAKKDTVTITLSRDIAIALLESLKAASLPMTAVEAEKARSTPRHMQDEPEKKVKGKKPKKGKPDTPAPDGDMWTPEELKVMSRAQLASAYEALGGSSKGLMTVDLRTRILEIQEEGGSDGEGHAFQTAKAGECDVTGDQGPRWAVEHDDQTWYVGKEVVDALAAGHSMDAIIEAGGDPG